MNHHLPARTMKYSSTRSKMSAFLRKSALFLGILWLVAACRNKDEVAPTPTISTLEATVGIQWMDLFLEVERYAPGYRPPVAARALGYINLAAYEAVIPSSAQYQSVASKFGLTVPKIESGKSYNWEVVVNEVYYVMMKNFFPHVDNVYKTSIDNLYRQIDLIHADGAEKTLSKQFGQAMAAAVFDYSKTDAAGHEGYLRNQPTDYVPPTGVGKWEPTFPDYGRALLPYWGKVRTFAISESEKIAKPPFPYSTNVVAPFFSQGLEVYSMTTPITYENKWIAEFWSDDIYKLTFEPAGRWIAVSQQVIRKEKVSLEKAIYTYVKISLALSDVGVACWNSKYIYNVARPITFIRQAIEPQWKSILNNPIANAQGVTPPFPSYPSGHSSFGAAAAEVLTDIYGNYGMTDRCHEGRTEFIGTPRTFNKFYEMAEENAFSRIVLGVHYRMDCDEGLRMGYVTGRKVNQLGWKK